MYKKYVAEFIGTFALTCVVLLLSAVGWPGFFGAIVAGLVLGLFVYTIGPISGCHINPAVTLAQLSVKKISGKDALYYILAQLLAAFLALLLSGVHWNGPTYAGVMPVMFKTQHFVAEVLGTFFFAFGIAAVVYGKAKEQMSGMVVGGSLFFGALVASFAGAMGILNPAVALAVNYDNLLLVSMYMLAPIVGAILGFQVYKFLVTEKQV